MLRFYINKTIVWLTISSLIINLAIPAGVLFASDAESALPSIEDISIDDSPRLGATVNVPPAPSKITLSTTIKDATVYLNGKIIGKTPLLETTEFVPGIYTIEVKKEGYSSWKKKVMIIEGETLVLTPWMVPLSAAELEAESKPPIVAKKSFYKSWWYWTLVVAAGGYALSKSGSDSSANEGSAAGTW